MPKISILLPVYNASKYLVECLDSIFEQRFTDFELIIVDDGSTDDTLKIIEKYQDARIKLLINNHNFVQSLNKGISIAQGKYIARMDADDIMLPNRLQVQSDFMEEHNEIDVCGTWFELMGLQERTIKNQLTSKHILLSLLLQNPLCHPSIMMKRDLIYKLIPENLYKEGYQYAEDYKLWIDLAMKGCQFAIIPEVLLKYRISENQVTFIHKSKMKEQSIIVQQEYSNYVLDIMEKKNTSLSNLISEIRILTNQKMISFRCAQNLIFSLYSESIFFKYMKDKPLVSVVMPLFNAENYLSQALESILRQSYSNIEFIIINDGSTDRSSSIVENVDDPRIIYINNSINRGNYICRNEGCKLAQGKYICVMDADDIALPNRIEKQVMIAEKSDSIIACGSFFKLFNEQICIKPQEYEVIKIYLLYNNMFLHPSLLIQRDILDKIGYYDESFLYSSDYNLACKLALAGEIVNISDPLIYYRTHSNQISSLRYDHQKDYANQIRLNYLHSCGFKLIDNLEAVFTRLMTDCKFVKVDIYNLYSLYDSLLSQNKDLKCFNSSLFDDFLKIKINFSLPNKIHLSNLSLYYRSPKSNKSRYKYSKIVRIANPIGS